MFCDRHKYILGYVPEDNSSMTSSYLLLDEDMCILDKSESMMANSEPILKMGVQRAREHSVWDNSSFVNQGGIYDCRRSDLVKDSGRCGGYSKDLQW